MNIAVASYGVGGFFFLILTLFLFTGRRKRRYRNSLILATSVSAVWMALAAFSAWQGSSALLPYILEPLRDFALLGFLAHLIYSPQNHPTKSYGHILLLLGSFSVLLITLVLYRVYAGGISLLAGGIDLLFAAYLVFSITGLVFVEKLMRDTRQAARWAIKYLCIGFGALFAYDFFLYSHALLFHGIDPGLWSARGLINALVVPLIGYAVSRNPYWSDDFYISRRAALHTTALLGSGLYLMAMGAGGYFVRSYGGTWGVFAQAVFFFAAVLILVVLLFSSQLRASLRVFLNKHFFQYKYEYRDEWLRLIETLGSEEPDKQLYDRSIQALADILDCPGGVLWVYQGASRYQRMAAWQAAVPDDPNTLFKDDSMVQYFGKHEWVINLQEYQRSPVFYDGLELPAWMKEYPDAWLITPLILHERLIGMVMLLRPPKLPSLNWEDYDLLRVGGRQAAAHLAQYNAALALSEAKQFEASSRKSAYVMHDLKNLIAQLSLIVSNAEKHKNNPVFMDDVIQTVDNSVNKMNRLIEKLNDGVGDKSKERINLCGLLHDVAQTMSGGLPRPSVDCQASGLLANADPDRFAAIIGHLIRNAQDATDDTGGIIVRLFKQRDKAIIEVQDDGSGMEKAFIRDELFKPFSTTKGKQGMGIGAHEVRDFVYKMGGDVEVISRPNEGTTFRIIIPRIAESDKIV